MKKLSQYLVAFGILSFLLVPALSSPTLVQAAASPTDTDPFGTGYVTEGDLNLSADDPRTVAVRIIKIALTFLAIIAVVIVIMGGFKWMTAGGNEEKVSEAKKLLGAGVIGLIIILAAWALTNFFLDTVATEILT